MKRILVSVLALCSFGQLFAQDNTTGVITSSEFHITRPLSEIAAENPVDEDKVYIEKESSDRQHRVAAEFPFTVADGPQYGNDDKTIQSRMGDVPAQPVRANVAGQTATGFRPFDPSGAVGPNHYIQMINSTTFKVYNKSTMAVLLTTTLGNLWSPATGNSGDPIVMYDKAADRWFLAQFGTSTDKKIYIAVSTTNDPTGSYYTYTYVSPQFPDYLKFSVWQDGYYMTSNQSTQKVFCFERDAMLAGTPGARGLYVNYSPPKAGFFVPLPGDAADGVLPPPGTPCPIFSYSDNGWGTGYSDAVNIYNMAVTWGATPTASITLAANVATAAFDASYNSSWNDVSQPGTTQKLDGIGGVCMYRAQWKSWSGYNTIVLNWAVKINTTTRSIKWVELRQNQSTGVWSMYQEGIYAPDADTRWMGSMAMDNNGSIGISYIKSNASSVYPGLFYTGRRTCDPLGTLPVTESMVIAGTGSQTGMNRVGDYSQTVLDPDGVTFWSTSEYMGGTTGTSAARTRIFSYQISPCVVNTAADVSIALTSGTNPTCTGSSVTFTATPTNGGTAPVYQWLVDGVNAGTNSPTFTSSSLTNGQIVSCVMTSNMPGVTANPATSNAITVTVNSAITPSVSIAISSGTNPTTSGSSVTFTATPVNGGTTPSYQWKVNSTNVGTNSSSYTTTALINGDVVSCVLTSSSSCASPSTAASNTITMTVTGSVAYCSASSSSTTRQYIKKVVIGTISNSTGATTYSNYTSLSTAVSVGVAKSITVTRGRNTSTNKVVIFCDWNNNGVFTDAGETVYTSAAGSGPFTTSITAPASAISGSVRMRIRLTDSATGVNLTSCGTSTYGEVEDYTLVVGAHGATPIETNEGAPVVSSIPPTVYLSVYPNPSAGDVTVKGENEGEYYLMNDLGKLILSIKLNADNNYTKVINGLDNGSYILVGQNKFGVSKQKVIVTK